MLAVINVLGSMLMLFSVTYVLPVVTSPIYRDGMLAKFIYAAVICVAAGAAMVHIWRADFTVSKLRFSSISECSDVTWIAASRASHW